MSKGNSDNSMTKKKNLNLNTTKIGKKKRLLPVRKRKISSQILCRGDQTREAN